MTQKKVRLVMNVDEEAHAILKTEASLTGRDMNEVFEELVRTHLTEAAQAVKRRRQKDKKPPGDKS